MATKKQRKRRYIPPANEVKEIEEGSGRRDVHVRTIQPSSKRAAPRTKGSAAQTRDLPEPSIRRTLRRLPIYFALIFLLQFYLIGAERSDLDTQGRALVAAAQAGVVTLAFAPFMHLMDRWTYNRIQRRMAQEQGGKRSGTKG